LTVPEGLLLHPSGLSLHTLSAPPPPAAPPAAVPTDAVVAEACEQGRKEERKKGRKEERKKGRKEESRRRKKRKKGDVITHLLIQDTQIPITIINVSTHL
jgi:hypothetical protein